MAVKNRNYYEAYEDRYLAVHRQALQWFSDVPTPIVWDVLSRYGFGQGHGLLELGCGEGRDARELLKLGLDLDATDISEEAVRYCRERDPDHRDHYAVLDCISGAWNRKYDFIFAVAVVHMLVEDSHRAAFYGFIRDHLLPGGAALVCSMGDGELLLRTDPDTAFALSSRCHQTSGQALMLPATSCRTVSTETFLREIRDRGLEILESGLTEAPPDFPVMMYAVIRRV